MAKSSTSSSQGSSSSETGSSSSDIQRLLISLLNRMRARSRLLELARNCKLLANPPPPTGKKRMLYVGMIIVTHVVDSQWYKMYCFAENIGECGVVWRTGEKRTDVHIPTRVFNVLYQVTPCGKLAR